MARRARRPSFRALPIDHLPLFLAAWQGLAAPGDSVDDLQEQARSALRIPGAGRRLGESSSSPPGLSPYYPRLARQPDADERTCCGSAAATGRSASPLPTTWSSSSPGRTAGAMRPAAEGKTPPDRARRAAPREDRALQPPGHRPLREDGQPHRHGEALEPGLAGAGHERRLRDRPPGDLDRLCPSSI